MDRMEGNPYADLPARAFWKTGVVQEDPGAIGGIYNKKFAIPPHASLAAAGSCFAQHISHRLRKNGYNVLDLEPAPPDLPEVLHQRFGFSTYSARHGNIYTARQLLQLLQEALGERSPSHYIWKKKDKFVDALRPSVEPEGLDSAEEVMEHRRHHLVCVRQLFEQLDVFFFTFGMTEMWEHRESGTVYPTAPGTTAGTFDPQIFAFRNATHNEVREDVNHFQSLLRGLRGGRPFQLLLTVSPVPLTATASGQHVLVANAYSKATLRSVAGQLSMEHDHIDYFPSHEIVNHPKLHGTAFADNLRSVREEMVEAVMNYFFVAHDLHGPEKILNGHDHAEAPQQPSSPCQEVDRAKPEDDQHREAEIACEEMILESFAPPG
ncbi:MAG: hypothetical protein RLZZ117_2403 [Cyanobacteriota bacterium]|jgi:hypothetical protein